MSSAPEFQAVVLWTSQGVRVFGKEKKDFSVVSDWLAQNDPLPSKVSDALTGNAILVLVGDSATGHVQLTLPNKKDELDDAHIGETLVKEYDIDLSAYEFASQKFPLARDKVQMSVSGIEKVVFQKILTWLAPFSPKKVWMMPVGWFLSPLKSVEPVLLAVADGEEFVSIAHHYLGVDDAREISLDDLQAYTKARKDERKETHLLYIHAPEALQAKLAKVVGETVAIHPLIGKASENIWLDVIQAVFQKGSESLGGLLHFDIDSELLPTAPAAVQVENVKSEKETSPEEEEAMSDHTASDEKAEAVAAEASADAGSHLPKPTPPEHAVARVEVIEEKAEEPKTASVSSEETPKEEKPEENEQPNEPIAPPAVEIEEVMPETGGQPLQPEAPVVAEPAVNEKAKAIFSELKASKVGSDNSERYVEMPQEKTLGRLVLIALVVAAFTALIGGGIFWSQQIPQNAQPMLPSQPTPVPTPAPTPEPVASESAAMTDEDKTTVKILVLNAEGTPGLANKAKQKLAAAGWKNIQTGNATGTYKDAVFIFSENSDLVAKIEEDAGASLTRLPTLEEKSGDGYDVVLILAEKIDW